ncbi:MAG: TnpV protein [Ruminococcus sp.]|nr:TnpV protein [Ruminococcus sp.]
MFCKSDSSYYWRHHNLADIDQQVEELFFRLVKQLAKKEGVTEQLKANNQMLWLKQMNNIRNRATEIVNAELIYT